MNRDGHKDVVYFIGPEVEHTPAYSKRTLFVVGKQDVVQIERMAREYKTPHIFLGANHSFSVDPTDGTLYWDKTITALLDKGFWVTLDYQAHEHKSVLLMLNKGIWQSRLFVPLLSVRIPNVQTSSTNLTIKIDDIDFKATNAGVWCLNHHEITDSNRFTDWQDYTTDEVVAPLCGPVPNPVLRVSDPTKMVHKATDEVIADNIDRMTKTGTLPVFADINKPAVNLENAKEKLKKLRQEKNEQSAEVESFQRNLNDPNIGLDATTPSMLKPEADAKEKEISAGNIKSPVDAAEAYADGATQDPLSSKEPAKKIKGKA